MSEKNPAVVPAIITNTNVAIPTNAPDIQKFITVRSAQVEMAKKVLKDPNAKLEVWYRELLNAAQEMLIKLLRAEVKLVKTVNADVAAETGINNTGTFHLICADCDSREFADYENPENYNDKPTQIMLSQIAQKSYLKEIYKQTKNIELHNLVRQIYNTKIGNLQELAALDRSDYIKQYLYAKNTQEPYFLVYYKCLPYTVPMTSQTRVALIAGFNGEIINNVYDLNPNTLLEDLHICIFPMKAKSIVMMFVRNGQKRLRPFYRDFLKISEDQQLQVLTYIILSYSEEVFFSKDLINQIKDLPKLGYVCGQTSMFNGYENDVKERLRELAQDYNLSNGKNIPNLLSAAYAINND